MPQISVIVPMYNVERFIARCLDSIFRQNDLPDIEVICVDDGSPDRSAEIASRRAAVESRLKVVSQANRGLGGARNTGLDVATGDYIAFIDSDDSLSDDYFRLLYDAAVENDADIAAANILKRRKTHSKYLVRSREGGVYVNPSEKMKACCCPPDFHVPNKLYRTAMLREGGFRFPEKTYYEDVMFAARTIFAARRLVTVPSATYYYIANGASITRSRQTPKKQSDKYNAHKEFVRFVDEHHIDIPDRYHSITKRVYGIGALTIVKVKVRGEAEYWRLFDVLTFAKKPIKQE